MKDNLIYDSLSEYTEAEIIQVIKAYLVDGLSHRKIQSEILGIPAPERGGGFKTMNILHSYNIHGDKKHALKNNNIENLILNSTGRYKEALIKLKSYIDEEADVENKIKGIIIEDIERTEIATSTKRRIGQDKLREYILKIYGNECALCQINKSDLLICSHIIPWNIDEENRLNPENAICLCALHDKLFDRGYFSLDSNYDIILTPKADEMIASIMKNLKFKKPIKNVPDIDLLKKHFKLFSN